MTGAPAAVALAVISAVVYAAAAVLQERVADRTNGPGDLSMLRRPLWWASSALNLLGGALHVVALRFGSLTLVQSLGALTLVAAVPMSAAVHRRRITGREWAGTALALAGLTAVLLFSRPTGTGAVPSPTTVLAVGGLTALLLATALTVALLIRHPGIAGLWFAAGAGVAFGASSLFTQAVVLTVSRHGPATGARLSLVLTAVAVAVLAFAGALLSHNAYRHGLGAPLATSTLLNPLYAAAVGLTLLDQPHAGGTYSAVGALAAVCGSAAGLTLLTRPATGPTTGRTVPPPSDDRPTANLEDGVTASALREDAPRERWRPAPYSPTH